MSSGWEVVAVSGWALLLLNLLLTLRLIRWLRSYTEAMHTDDDRAELPELEPGVGAPAFRAKDLSGRPVRSEDFAGRELALVFVSPHCGMCRDKVPELAALASTAERTSAARIVLVSDSPTGETRSWLDGIAAEHGAPLAIPLLVAPRNADLHTQYNPRGLSPYFCHVGAGGEVTARGGLHTPDWTQIARRWSGGTRPSRPARRYM